MRVRRLLKLSDGLHGRRPGRTWTAPPRALSRRRQGSAVDGRSERNSHTHNGPSTISSSVMNATGLASGDQTCPDREKNEAEANLVIPKALSSVTSRLSLRRRRSPRTARTPPRGRAARARQCRSHGDLTAMAGDDKDALRRGCSWSKTATGRGNSDGRGPTETDADGPHDGDPHRGPRSAVDGVADECSERCGEDRRKRHHESTFATEP